MAETSIRPGPFRRHDKVVTGIDLEGIPAGTRGKVMYVAGFTWQRCRVKFVNGVERGGLDARHLVTVAEWDKRAHDAAVADARAEQARLADELRSKLVTGGTH
jgi:alpha-D-ribose 1-methylphosphonate 5-triphosphate synthase subunit PhnG